MVDGRLGGVTLIGFEWGGEYLGDDRPPTPTFIHIGGEYPHYPLPYHHLFFLVHLFAITTSRITRACWIFVFVLNTKL